MTQRKLLTDAAGVALAYALDLSGMGAMKPLGQKAIAWVASCLDPELPGSIENTLARMQAGLEMFLRSERISEEHAFAASANALAIVNKYGLDTAGLIKHDLDASASARAVLEAARPELESIGEPEASLCRALVERLYRLLLDDPHVVRDLEAAFRRVLLQRLNLILEQARSTSETLRAAARQVAAGALLNNPSRVWMRDRFPPSALLRAEYRIVPFSGRDETMSEIRDWCDAPPSVAVRLYTAPGGMGKTRLFLEVCARLVDEGWAAGFLVERGVSPELLDSLLRASRRILIVVDYAETRRSAVLQVLRHAAIISAPMHVRVVLIARAAADWWWALQGEGAGVGDLITGEATRHIRLTPVATAEREREQLLERAGQSFGAVLGLPGLPSEPTRSADLNSPLFDRVLFLHLHALAEVIGQDAQGEDGLLDFLLDRERAFWDGGMRALGLDHLAGRAITQAAAVATLAGSAHDRPAAIDLIRAVPLLAGQPEVVLDQIVELLHRLYPSERWLAGVQPDLLGERLVERVTEDDPRLLALFGNRS